MKITSVEDIEKRKWITLKQAKYVDKNGKPQTWEYLSRNNAREVVTVICRSKRYNKYLFIAQPRVPINKIEISFPAGLIDKGETPAKAALRELKEETGYKGEVIKISELYAKSAGLSDEKTYFVECVVDEKAIQHTEMEDTEDIQSFWKTPLQFVKMAEELDTNKTSIAAEVWSFILGYLYSKKY